MIGPLRHTEPQTHCTVQTFDQSDDFTKKKLKKTNTKTKTMTMTEPQTHCTVQTIDFKDLFELQQDARLGFDLVCFKTL